LGTVRTGIPGVLQIVEIAPNRYNGCVSVPIRCEQSAMNNPTKLTVILEPEEDGGYSVHCPALPGCHSQGNSLDEALENIKEAILLVLEVRHKKKLPIPKETPEIVTGEIRQILATRAEDGLPLIIETREVELPAEVAV
jgi:predicted RNase H-like HicB family nuclease